jgi:multidrug efflux pump subunit AcrA (membrane-fusion protein)
VHRNLAGQISCLVLSAFVLALSGCGRSYSSSARPNLSEQPQIPAKPVKTVRLSAETYHDTVEVSGSLAAYDQATLSTKVAGRLQKLEADLGSVVKDGDLVAQIDPRDYQLRVQQAQALLAQARARVGLPLEGTNDVIAVEMTSTVRQTRALLDEAKANLDRIKRLSEQGIISTSELETAGAAHEVALSRQEDALLEVRNRQALVAQRRSELEIARQQLAETGIYAPFNGVVQDRRANLGEYLNESSPVLIRTGELSLRYSPRFARRSWTTPLNGA